MVELKDFIVRTRLDNTDEKQKTGDSAFDTHDFVFFETKDEVEDITDKVRYIYASDYAVMNGAVLGGVRVGPKDRQPTWHWLRSAYSKNNVNNVNNDGDRNNNNANKTNGCARPDLPLKNEFLARYKTASLLLL